MPDTFHGPTLLEGAKARFARNPPKTDKNLMRGLSAFVEDFVTRNFTPIPANEDVSVERWLSENTTYTKTRKAELQRLWDSNQRTITPIDYLVKTFTKTENYPCYKHARAINSRSDMAKCFFGPFFHLIEKVVYAYPAFIKHVPVRERPRYILTMLGKYPGPFMETDYSQFESHFVPDVMNSLEMILYRYMLQNFPHVMEHIESAMTGMNRCTSRHFLLKVLGRRMSGEMCTSLGNGFSNLMLASYAAHLKGGGIEGVVEGDDGLFYCTKDIGTDDFSRLGFRIKMKIHDDLLQSSFCGLVMSRDLQTMTSPIPTIISFGWTHSPLMLCGPKIRQQLLRAKALSLAYEHPRCPILSALALTVLRHTAGVKPRHDTGWYSRHLVEEVQKFKEETESLLAEGPSLQTRIDFARLYQISIPEQLSVERELFEWRGGPLGPHVVQLCRRTHPDVRHYDMNYVRGSRRY